MNSQQFEHDLRKLTASYSKKLTTWQILRVLMGFAYVYGSDEHELEDEDMVAYRVSLSSSSNDPMNEGMCRYCGRQSGDAHKNDCVMTEINPILSRMMEEEQAERDREYKEMMGQRQTKKKKCSK